MQKESKNHVKTITRHIWEPYIEICEDTRHTTGMKVGLTFAWMNLKKLTKMKRRNGLLGADISRKIRKFINLYLLLNYREKQV